MEINKQIVSEAMVDIRADGLSKPFNEGVYRFPLTCKRTHKTHTAGIFYGESPLHYSFTLIMLEVIFVVVTTWIVRFLLKPLKQPRVVSEIIVSFNIRHAPFHKQLTIFVIKQ